MIKYEVGKVIPEYIGHAEETRFDIADSGAIFIAFFDSPTIGEVEQFSRRFEIRYTAIYDVIMVAAKIGNLDWMDAPYSPHLSRALTSFNFPSDSQGLALNLMLVDSKTGILKSLRLLGLSSKFTRSLFGDVMESKMREFDEKEYQELLSKIFSRYKTSDIVKMSKNYCKFD